MGAFKPLLPFGGRTVAEACVENLLASGVREVVVVVVLPLVVDSIDEVMSSSASLPALKAKIDPPTPSAMKPMTNSGTITPNALRRRRRV